MGICQAKKRRNFDMQKSISETADTLFRAFDLRIVADDLSSELSQRLIHAIGLYVREQLKTETIVLCRDARLSGNRLLQQGIDVFSQLGFTVITNVQSVSTCQFYYICLRHGDAAGIMYSASHNPGVYTGQKIVGPQVVPIAQGYGPLGGLDRIKANFIRGIQCPTIAGGNVTCVDYMQDYIDFTMDLSGVTRGSLAGLRILCEYVSGSVGTEIALAFQQAGATVKHRNLVPDGSFPQGDPNPMMPATIRPMIQQLAKGSFDFGFCFDGDGDRIDILDTNGDQLNPSLNFSIICEHLKHIIPTSDPSLGYHAFLDPKASPFARLALQNKGITSHLVKNGHSIIKRVLLDRQEENFIGAVEESAHYYIKLPYPFPGTGSVALESSLLIALLTARCWKENPSQYSDMMIAQRSIHRQREWGYRFDTEEERINVLQVVADHFERDGASLILSMETGENLGGTLIRKGFSEMSCWLQVAQRRSESEEGVARWEVMSDDYDLMQKSVTSINFMVLSLCPNAIRIG